MPSWCATAATTGSGTAAGSDWTVWTVKARTTSIRALGRQLKRDGIEMVTLESTSSDYLWDFCGARGVP